MNFSRYGKTFKVLGCFTFLGLLFFIFELDIYRWLCDNEKNRSACFLTGKKFKIHNNDLSAEKYFKKSCELGYKQGCKQVEKHH